MGNIIHAANRFSRGLPRASRENPVRWGCVDDRYILEPGLYRQTAGGPIGAGDDMATAISLSKHGRNARGVIEKAEQVGSRYPVQILGGIAAKTVRQEGVELVLHRACAAELEAPAIANLVAQGGAELFSRTVQIRPNMERDKFEQIVEVKSEIIAAGRIMDPAVAASHLDAGQEWRSGEKSRLSIPPLPRVALVDSEHVSPLFLPDWRTEIAFDSRAAFTDKENPMPAYHASFGDMADEIAYPLSDVIGFDVEDFLDASAVRHAATTMALDAFSPTGQIEIHNLQAAA